MPISSARCPTAARRRPSLQPAERNSLPPWASIRNQVCRPDLHRADRADPQHGREAEAERQSRAHQGQAGDLSRRTNSGGAGTTSRKIKGEWSSTRVLRKVHFRIASPPTAWPVLLRCRHAPAREASRRHDVGRGDARAPRRQLPALHLARRALPRGRRRRGAADPAKPAYLRRLLLGRNTPSSPADMIEKGLCAQSRGMTEDLSHDPPAGDGFNDRDTPCPCCGRVFHGVVRHRPTTTPTPGPTATAPSTGWRFSRSGEGTGLTTDLCTWGAHRFIRAVLPIPIRGSDKVFSFGPLGRG